MKDVYETWVEEQEKAWKKRMEGDRYKIIPVVIEREVKYLKEELRRLEEYRLCGVIQSSHPEICFLIFDTKFP